MNNSSNPLTNAVDILFTLAIFYALVQWTSLATWQSKLLWIGLFLIIVNEQVSVRASYDVYNILIYILDLVSLLMYVIALHALTVIEPRYGYDPTFWIAVAFIWLFYAIWDYVMMPFADKAAKRNLRKWATYMISAFIATIVCYIIIRFAPNFLQATSLFYVESISHIIAFGIIIWALYLWNKDRLSRALEIMNESKGTKRFQ